MRNYKFISDEWHLSHTETHACFLHDIFFGRGRNNKHTQRVIWVNNSEIEFNVTRKWWPCVFSADPHTNGGVYNYFNYNFVLPNGFQFTFLSLSHSFTRHFCLLNINFAWSQVCRVSSLNIEATANCLISLLETRWYPWVNYRPQISF